VKNVDVAQTYERIDGDIVPVVPETKTQVRFLDQATLA
jgi:hypothetical protein